MGLISRVSSRTYRSLILIVKIKILKNPDHAYRNVSIFWPKGLSRPRQKLHQSDGKRVVLISGKSEVLYKNKKNPRKITWTILYRRKNKKGTMTEIDAKKRKRRTVKTTRGAGSQSWAEIQAKKAQRPEIRKAQKEAAIEKAKAKKKEQAARKKATTTTKKPAQKQT